MAFAPTPSEFTDSTKLIDASKGAQKIDFANRNLLIVTFEICCCCAIEGFLCSQKCLDMKEASL